MIDIEKIARDLINELEGHSLINRAEAEGVRKFYGRIVKAGEAAKAVAEKSEQESKTPDSQSSRGTKSKK